MATVEKMPMLQMGYDKLNEQLRELKAERPHADPAGNCSGLEPSPRHALTPDGRAERSMP